MAHTKDIKKFFETVEYATMNEITDALGIARGSLYQMQMKHLVPIGTKETKIIIANAENNSLEPIYGKGSFTKKGSI